MGQEISPRCIFLENELAGTRYLFWVAPDLRRLIYTTNMIESYHRQLRKVTKGKSLFPNDESLLKMLYLATCDVQRRWTMRIAHWGQILAQLTIVYPDRIKMPN